MINYRKFYFCINCATLMILCQIAILFLIKKQNGSRKMNNISCQNFTMIEITAFYKFHTRVIQNINFSILEQIFYILIIAIFINYFTGKYQILEFIEAEKKKLHQEVKLKNYLKTNEIHIQKFGVHTPVFLKCKRRGGGERKIILKNLLPVKTKNFKG